MLHINACTTRSFPCMGTNFGPEEMARISCDPYGEINVPNLASISMFVLPLLLLLFLRRAIDRDWIKNNLIASSGWVGRERNGFRADDDADDDDTPDGRSADDLFASFDDWATRLPSAPAGRLLLDMMLLLLFTSTI